jgi:hypothetical protein
MQNHVITQYYSMRPGFDDLAGEIEAMLQVYSEIAIILSLLLFGIVVSFLICEMRETRTDRMAPRGRPLAGRELTDTGF